MTNNIISTIIFDLDGTIVDTEPAAARAVDLWARELKLNFSPDEHQCIAGVTWEKAIAHLLKKYQIKQSLNEALSICLKNYRSSLIANLKEIPGATQAVRELSQSFKLGLVSGSHQRDILEVLDYLKIRQHFQIIYGCEDYPESKPSPSGYIKAMGALHSVPRQTLIFEDSNPGIKAAHSAGTWVVAIEYANHFKHDQTLANIKIRDFTNINRSWIKTYFQ
jgi:HAD superfamily hydrolase (TIGR01509 family)